MKIFLKFLSEIFFSGPNGVCRLERMPKSNPNDVRNPETDSAEEYLLLLNEHEQKLGVYVHALVNSPEDAEDILQACRLTMWKKFDSFERGTNFLAWGRKIALHQVLNHRRSGKRKPLHATDPEVLEAIAAEIDRQSDALDARSLALRDCLQRLPESQRQTILLRYYEDAEIGEIASETNRSEGAVYQLLSRIRSALNDCISERLAQSAS